MLKKENEITKKALLTALAIAFGTSQSSFAEGFFSTKPFNLKELNTSNQFLAHDALQGDCPGHQRQLIDQQKAFEQKQKKKKKNKKNVQEDETTSNDSIYKYQTDEDDEE